jgi:hypothetical protein
LVFIHRGQGVRIGLACALSLAICGAASSAYGKWSSGMVAKREASGLAIRGFQPNMTASNCLTIRGRDARDQLICRTFWAADGQRMTSISEVIVTTQNGTPAYEFKPIVEARDTREARGANIVDCEPVRLKLFEIKTIARGAAPGLIDFDAAYADRTVVQRACMDKGLLTASGKVQPEADEAYVPHRDEQIATLQLDIHKRAVELIGSPR